MPLPTMPLTLRTRLALWAALATGLAVVLVATGLFWSVNSLLQDAQLSRLNNTAMVLSARLERELRHQEEEGFPEITGYALSGAQLEGIVASTPDARRLGLRVLGTRNGELVQVATSNFPPHIAPDLRGGPRPYLTSDRRHLIVVRPLLRNQVILQVAADAQVLGDAQRAFGQALSWLLPLALGVSLALGWLVAGRLLRPVGTLEAAAEAIGKGGDLRQPLPGAGDHDELARLALTLQRSFGHLADAREREQSFLRAAAHDLRSPLAALQARVDGTLAYPRESERYRHELMEIGQDIARLSTLANHLLLLARDPSALSRSAVALHELAAEAVDRARELDPLVDVDLRPSVQVTVQGDRILLGQAIWNLTLNAVRHAPGATIGIRVSRKGDMAEITVQDDGPGVPPEVLARLGEAFYRPSESRSGDGHGLGLALVKRAAELHRGTLELSSRPGQGLSATLRLPCYPAEHVLP